MPQLTYSKQKIKALLATVTADLGSNYACTGSYANSGLSISLPAGKWQIMCIAASYQGGVGYQGLMKLRDTTNNIDLTGEVRTPYVGNSDCVGQTTLFALATLIGTTTVSLQSKNVTGSVTILGDPPANGVSRIFAVRLA